MPCTGLRVLGDDGLELPITTFMADISVQLSTAFVSINADFQVTLYGPKVLEFPIDSNVTVTKCTITTNNRTIDTCVLPKDVLEQYAAANRKSFRYSTVKLGKTVFYVPFQLTKHEQQLSISLAYFYSLPFDPETGRYTFSMPCTFSDPARLNTVGIKFGVNTASPSQYVQYGSSSHKFKHVNDVDAWYKNFEVEEWVNKDFEFNYAIATQDILASVILNNIGQDPYDPRATFCVNLHPPPDSHLANGFFGRRVVFLIDTSGSMGGEAINQAKSALHTGLTQLRHFWDQFNIIAFNSHLLNFAESVVEANPASVQAAIEWVGGLQATGGTEMLPAVQSAGAMLSNPAFAGDNKVPVVFLMTDGAVENEKTIYQWVLSHCQNIRFHTLGIGDMANAYFLKMLAMAGRGLNDHIVNSKNIFKQVLSLLRAATTPILTNVEVLLPVQSNQYEIFPYPVPDLFCGHPLMISGKVAVNFDHALIRGMLPNGQVYQVQVKPQISTVILHKVFARQRLDYMIGQAWAHGNAADIAAVVKMSSMYSMPTPYTVMVAYQRNPKKHTSEQPILVNDLVAVSAGSVILLSGLALTFGDVVATRAGAVDAFVHDPFPGGANATFQVQNSSGGGCSECCRSCCDCLEGTFCCCCTHKPCCPCCRSKKTKEKARERQHHSSSQGTGDDCCWWCCYTNSTYNYNNDPYYYGDSGNSDCCCKCDHCGTCNCCDGCFTCAGDDCRCDCCSGCDAGCADCCTNCNCDCGNCGDCNCDGCGDCNCDGCGDCNCDCGGDC